MPTWGQLLQELNTSVRNQMAPIPGQPSPHDRLRRKYLRLLADHTGRATIVYATSWLEPATDPAANLDIHLGDVQAFMEACSNITGRSLDLILTTPGGSPEAAESIIAYLRTRFDHIRAIVPIAAMSAGTMIALACDEIVLGQFSQLGPIDPQITVLTPEGPRSSPAQTVLDQFELAKKECADPKNIGGWLPLLRALLPGLLAYCISAQRFSKEFVQRELATRMLASMPDPGATAKQVVDFFSNFTNFNSHSKRISRADISHLPLRLTDMESDKIFQDLVLSVHHTTRLSFGAGVTKLVENDQGRAFIEMRQQLQMVAPNPFSAAPQNPAAAPPKVADPARTTGPRPGARPVNSRPRKRK